MQTKSPIELLQKITWNSIIARKFTAGRSYGDVYEGN